MRIWEWFNRTNLFLVFLFISTQCYPAKTLFESFSIDDANGLSPQKFEEICPALVEQIESKACVLETDQEEEQYGKQSKTQGKSQIYLIHQAWWKTIIA